MDCTSLRLDVYTWRQSISHGEKWPSRSLQCSASSYPKEELLIGVPNIHKLPFHLSIHRGEPKPEDPPLERGIGILGSPDIDLTPQFHMFVGWWWMPEALYDEVWVQVRNSRWTESAIDMDIAPIQFQNRRFTWDIQNQKSVHVLRATIEFHRLKASAVKPESVGLPKRGWMRSLSGAG